MDINKIIDTYISIIEYTSLEIVFFKPETYTLSLFKEYEEGKYYLWGGTRHFMRWTTDKEITFDTVEEIHKEVKKFLETNEIKEIWLGGIKTCIYKND